MRKPARLIYAKAVRGQLVAIGRYTEESWGIKQRDTYLKKLFAAFEKLKKAPPPGKTRNELYKGLRSLRVEKHVIYYRVNPNTVIIVGVLHERMDPLRHL